jgi:hypothetical protein
MHPAKYSKPTSTRGPAPRDIILSILSALLLHAEPCGAATFGDGHAHTLPSGPGTMSSPQIQTATPGQQRKAKPTRKAKPLPPTSSEESRTERERRLYRECAGRPNAGACEGFAH